MDHRFVRCYSKVNRNGIDSNGKTYYVADEHGNVFKIGNSARRSTKNFRYAACPLFVAKFHSILPIGSITKWNNKLDFEVWMHQQIFFSWAVTSNENNWIPWFLKGITAESKVAPTLVPAGYRGLFQRVDGNQWILVQSGWKVYPIYVTENHLGDGWDKFWADHNLEEKFLLMFGAERQWIFNVVIFDGNKQRLSYSWTEDVTKINTILPKPENVVSVFPSSILVTKSYQVEFGVHFISLMQLYQVVRDEFKVFLVDEDVAELKFEMGHIKWIVKKHGNDLDEGCVLTLMRVLKLRKYDFIYMAATDAATVSVVVFGFKNGTERQYV